MTPLDKTKKRNTIALTLSPADWMLRQSTAIMVAGNPRIKKPE
jgi:hypothetical protein